MAFTRNALSPISTANSLSGKLWMYEEAAVTIAAMSAASYFDGAAPEMTLTSGDIILAIGLDGTAFLRVSVSSGTVTTADVYAAGANMELVTADKVLDAADNGKTFVLEKAAGIAVTLPAVANGLKYKFISGTIVVTSVGHVITGTAGTIEGSVTVAGLVVAVAAGGVITMTANAVLPGDWFTLESDGVNWYIAGQATASTGIAKTS